MSKEFLRDRRSAFEEIFFAKQDAKVLAQLRSEREKKAAREGLARATSIDDPDLLERLVELGLDARSWTALSLVPLVEVAWADGRVEERERKAVLTAARDHGLHRTAPGYVLLEHFLRKRPEASLFASWGAFMTELAAELSPSERAALSKEIVDRARKVAAAAGGILGLGSISEAETRVLAALERPFA
ncbi:MAG TPA: hypothetical protein VKH41_06575 [Myxococcota bacterium]|nr:hypothetical protein [Myxococcota bacterium]